MNTRKQPAASSTADPFGTTTLRRVVLDSWAASPARFREDANAEEALVVGGYAGRVLVELASNAADAAGEMGVPARIRVRLHNNELRVANTGSPLTAAGVAALSSLRASAKRGTLDSVGHFGVGFTAVLSWSRAPRVISSTGGVRFDAGATAAEIASLGKAALDREVTARSGQVPVLRLPWPTDSDEEPPPAGYATEVRLPLDAATMAEVQRTLAGDALAEDLFWALTDLAEIDLPERVVRCGIDDRGLTVIDDGASRQRYRTASQVGVVPAPLLADRPIEERERGQWRITWALPVSPDPSVISAAPGANEGPSWDMPAPGHRGRSESTTIGAPTPTDEPLTLPARLIGTFPVDDTRRRLATGPLNDYLLERAADTYLELIAATAPAQRWELMPVGGFPAGPIDGLLRAAVLNRVAQTRLLLTAAGDLVTPADACMLPGVSAQGAALLGQAIPGLLPPMTTGAATVLRGLGVATLTWSQASSALAGIERDPQFWWHVYEAAWTAERPPVPEDLADIPVPLSNGRRAVGARGCLLPAAGSADVGSADAASAWTSAGGSAGRDDSQSGDRIDAELARRASVIVPALRIVDPLAAHPLLERLGARAADPDTLLADPGLVAAMEEIRRELEDADPDPDDVRDLATLVLDLLAAGGRAGRAQQESGHGPGVRTDLANGPGRALFGELVLTDDDGQPWPADDMLLPGAPLADVLLADPDRPVVAAEWTDRYETDVLQAGGVRSGFAVVQVDDPDADDVDLPDLDEWLDLMASGPVGAGEPVVSFTALADLDLIDPDRWAQALEMIAEDRDARACLAPTTAGPSYTGWWLSRHALIDGYPPVDWRLATAWALSGLFDPLPIALDPQFAQSLGVRSDLAAAAIDDPEDLLDRLADPARPVAPGTVGMITEVVVAALAGRDDVDLPSGVRTISGAVVNAADACVLDEPWLAQVMAASSLVPGGSDHELVARVLDLPLASTLVRHKVITGGVQSGPAEDPAAGAGGQAGTVAGVVQAQGRLERAAAAIGVHLPDCDIVIAGPLLVEVDGADPVAVRWWGQGGRYWTDGSAQGSGKVVAWAAGSWAARHRAIAAAGQDWTALAEDGAG